MNKLIPPDKRTLNRAIVGILILRLAMMIWVPLLDKTEARYGEIARLMHESRNWVVLQFDYGIPFWGKPPLSSWLSALSFDVFGVSAFASRLPSFLLSLLVICLVIKALQLKDSSKYILAFLLLTTPEFLIHTGVTSTDSALLLGIVLTMIGFWRTLNDERRTVWSYLFFVGIGIGLLAKGPIVIILTGPPIFVWCFMRKGRWKPTFTKLPWLLGLPLTALIAIPWYYLAEQQTPGFIDYFIVGEHFKRFTESGWEGDKYGFAKSQPLGMIWLFLLAFAVPWIQLLLYKLFKNWKQAWKDPWVSFLLLWMLWTPLFFTISRNVIHTYILPSIIPMALLLLHYRTTNKTWFRIGMVFPILVFLAASFLWVSGSWTSVMNTDKYVMERLNVQEEQQEVPLVYWAQKTYSGRFYAGRPIDLLTKVRQLDSLTKQENPYLLFVQKKRSEEIPARVYDRLVLIDSSMKRRVYQPK